MTDRIEPSPSNLLRSYLDAAERMGTMSIAAATAAALIMAREDVRRVIADATERGKTMTNNPLRYDAEGRRRLQKAADKTLGLSERAHALVLADLLLDEPNADPDDDLRTLARNLRHASSKERWLNVLAVLESIDRHTLEAAGLVWNDERWAQFRARPAHVFRLLDDSDRAKVWAIVEWRLDGK